MRKLILAAACAAFLSGPAQASTFRGDVNLDGRVNVLDVVRMLSIVVGNLPMPANPCSDVDGDGMVTVLDAVRSLNVIVGNVDPVLCDECAERFHARIRTVFDCHTGLLWEKKTAANVLDFYTWSDGPPWDPDGTAFTNFLPGLGNVAEVPACTTTSECTSDDRGLTVTCTTPPPTGCWRLPEIDELRTIVESCPPCIDRVFGSTLADPYWSATSLSGSPDEAWALDFGGGGVVRFPKGNDFLSSVRAVRSDP